MSSWVETPSSLPTCSEAPDHSWELLVEECTDSILICIFLKGKQLDVRNFDIHLLEDKL
jgi:hypothetical protein